MVSRAVERRITSTLFVSQSLFSASAILSFTLTPIISAHLSGSDSAAGVPPTMTMLGRAVAAYPVGWLMDRTGRRIDTVYCG
jgi:MFS family permease